MKNTIISSAITFFSIARPVFMGLLLLIVTCQLSVAQVGIRTTGNPNSSAMLDVQNTGKGLLVPRMTNAQRTAMNPLPQAAQGLLVYQIDGTEGFYYNTSTNTTPNWVSLSGSSSLWTQSGNDVVYASGDALINGMTVGRGSGNWGSNTAIGYNALPNNTFGDYNTAIGYQALFDNTTGAYNTAIGINALILNTTGSSNTAIGFSADVSASNLTNASAIGYQATVNASNKIQLGNSSVTAVATSGQLTTGAVTYPTAHGTSGQVLSTTGSGSLAWVSPGGVPSGAITMWHGLIANIPGGWVLCDGTNGTPDLRDRFVVGAAASTEAGGTGGANSKTLSTSEMPVHAHTISPNPHSHVFKASQGNSGGYPYQLRPIGQNNSNFNTEGTSLSISSAGSGSSFDNRPAFFEIIFIMKQ